MDEFRALQQSMKGPGSIGWWSEVLPELGEDQRESLLAAASDRHISHRVISMVLGQWGFTVTTAQVGHWRRNHHAG